MYRGLDKYLGYIHVFCQVRDLPILIDRLDFMIKCNAFSRIQDHGAVRSGVKSLPPRIKKPIQIASPETCSQGIGNHRAITDHYNSFLTKRGSSVHRSSCRSMINVQIFDGDVQCRY